MSDLRARPLDVCMSDSMPFAQRWTCRTTWPLADVLNNEYFLNMRQTLRAGDMIRICRFDRASSRSVPPASPMSSTAFSVASRQEENDSLSVRALCRR